VSEARIMTEPAASAHLLDDGAVGKALLQIGAIGPALGGAGGAQPIRSPWFKPTLTRTSCRALPRSLTHTTIGKPVVLGRRFAIRKKSVSGSSIDMVDPTSRKRATH
jgi:hypothetical protein